MRKQRIQRIVLILGLVVVMAVGSWVAGLNIKSPAEVAAQTAPPVPSAILVPIEKRLLSSDIVTRGAARFGLPKALSIAQSALKLSSGIITTLPVRETQLDEGSVVLTASGRPLFLLQGAVPVYRDMTPGLAGDDVRQLEEALNRMGFTPGKVDGLYDGETSVAVAAWYKAAGWEPFDATPEQLAAIRTLEQELAVADNAKLAAVAAVNAAPNAITAARSNAESANVVAATTVDVKRALLDKVMTDPASTNIDRSIATAEVAIAEINVSNTQIAGEIAIQAAIDAESAAKRELKIAEATVKRLTADVEVAKRKAAVQVPVDEVLFVPNVPVRIEQVSAQVGDAAVGPILTVTNFQLAIDSSLQLEEAALVRPGMPIAIDEPALGITATGKVGRVADTPGTFGVDSFHIYLEGLVDGTPANLVGVSVRLKIPIQSTGGEVLVVPLSALSLAADGNSRVQVQKENGELEFTVVTPGLSADGFVEVTPVKGTLTPGQLVVVGYEER